MKSSNDNQAVLTVTDLMKRWRCSRRSVLDAIHARKLSAFTIGKRAYRVSMVEVERYELARDSAA